MRLPPDVAAKVLQISGTAKPTTRMPKREPVRGKRSKYGSKKVTLPTGEKFDSKREAERFVVLELLRKSGLVSDLQRQVRYDLTVNGIKVCAYVADFVYLTADGIKVVEDVKGFKTREYILKRKLMKAVHGVEIREV